MSLGSSVESEQTLEQLFAEREAKFQEWMRDWAEFKRLAVKLGIPLSALKVPSTIPANTPELAAIAPPDPFPSDKPVAANGVIIRVLTEDSLTVGELIAQYRTHPDSTYQKLKFAVRRNYDSQIDRLVREIGDTTLRDLDSGKLLALHAGWADGGKTPTAHGLIGKLRLLCTFGITVLKNEDAVRLGTILNRIKVPIGEGKRMERLTAEQARLIRAKAHDMRWHSIALIQAFQFDFADTFRQMDIIGEWVPMDEPGESDIIRTDAQGRQEKWLRGILWSEVDDRLILRHRVTSGRESEQKIVKVDLKQGAMVMEEINRLSPQDKVGPIALCEFTGKPWMGTDFRRRWRQAANLAGVPKNVKNMDTGRPAQDDEESDEGDE
jgi:hypothetical protein